jgi:hypothetical protein
MPRREGVTEVILGTRWVEKASGPEADTALQDDARKRIGAAASGSFLIRAATALRAAGRRAGR